jgi:hypothetical protein
MNQSPPPVPSSDLQHLKLIGIFHYVLGGLAVIGIAFLLVHYMIMNTVFSNPKIFQNQPNQPPFDPVQFWHVFIWMYVLVGAWGIASLIANVVSGFCIQTRRARMFSLVVAGFNCINFPFGTALGIFTFIVLLRPSMPGIYQEAKTA